MISNGLAFQRSGTNMAGNYKDPDYMIKWRSERRVHISNSNKSYRTSHPRDPRRAKDYALRRNYGLTLEEFERLAAQQDFKCAICHEPRKLHVDHNHHTGKVRGLLCHYCNTALGSFDDDPQRILKAIAYLKQEYA